MSAFVYNAQGQTSVDGVAPIVFCKDADKMVRYLNQKYRANPPPAFINQHLDQTAASAFLKDDETDARRIRTVLREVEDRIFDGKHKSYQVFRKFDKDGDGFVSYKDFEDHLLSNKINVTSGEVEQIMKNVLDPENRGYIDFTTFSKRFGVNMSSQINVTDKEVHSANLVPNKTKLNEYGKKSQGVRSKIAEVTASFKPEVDQSKSYLKYLNVFFFRIGKFNQIQCKTNAPKYIP